MFGGHLEVISNFNQFLSTKNRMLHHTLAKQKTKYHLMIFGHTYLILSDYYFLNAQFFYPKVDDRRKGG